MTPTEIRDAVLANPTLQAMQASGNYAGIASALSVGRTKIVTHFASERGILERYPHGPVLADVLLTKLETFAVSAHPLANIVKRAMKFMAQPDGIDIGSLAVQSLLTELHAGSIITQQELDGLKLMATVSDVVSHEQVFKALEV